MKNLVFARWGTTVEDLRAVSEPGHEVPRHLLPYAKDLPVDVSAVMCGKGFLLFDPELDFVQMIREYVRRIQSKYCCGKCLTGIKGTKMLQLILDRISGGDATEEDLELLERVANILNDAAKCSICQSSGELALDGLKHFRDHFMKAVQNGLPKDRTEYVAKISAPCMTTCPSHIDIPRYIELLQEIRYEESLKTIRREMPLPGITGRVCPAPCERACTLANFGCRPIPIRVLKRVAADYEVDHKLTPPLEANELTGQPVAVVGAGPAGLSAAYYLNRLGHPVTVFEALPVSGGMVGVGIPPYRQPREVLQNEIKIILKLGVNLEEGVRIGPDFALNKLFDMGFKAIFLGVGSHQPVPLGIKGEDQSINGVFRSGIDFLRAINLGEAVKVGDRILVVGGGNTAIDCARTCLRMGAADVRLVYRRTEKEMPSDPKEVEDAVEEGITCYFLTQPLEVLSENGVMTGMRCIRMELGEPDASGRRRPVPIEGSEFIMEADTLIPAIGQRPDVSFLSPQDGITVTKHGTIEVDRYTMMTSRPGIFAAGDVVSGPLTVVHGVAGGKTAAKMIHQYLAQGKCERTPEQLMEEVLTVVEKDTGVRVTPRPETRAEGPVLQKRLDMRERLSTFEEVESGLSQYGSHVESSRCLRCYHLVMAATKQ